jgi:hypothetical protein
MHGEYCFGTIAPAIRPLPAVVLPDLKLAGWMDTPDKWPGTPPTKYATTTLLAQHDSRIRAWGSRGRPPCTRAQRGAKVSVLALAQCKRNESNLLAALTGRVTPPRRQQQAGRGQAPELAAGVLQPRAHT